MNPRNDHEPKDFALVPSTRHETKTLVRDALHNTLADTGKELDVSRKWLIEHVERLGLTQDQVETFVSIRSEYGGALKHAVKLLYKGLTVEEALGCYRVQRELSVNDKGYRASVVKIAKLIRSFPEADPDLDYLADEICRAHDCVSERYFWVRYADQTIKILCGVAEKYECATLDGAISMIESRHPKEDGVVNGDESDEVERQRRDYENRRNR